MSRLLLVLGLAFHIALSTGAMPTFEDDGCADGCPEGPEECAGDCVWCPHHRVVAVVLAPMLLTDAGFAKPLPQRQAEPGCPEPNEILHVPIA